MRDKVYLDNWNRYIELLNREPFLGQLPQSMEKERIELDRLRLWILNYRVQVKEQKS